MKIQNIYHLLQAALFLLLAASCTQEEFPAAQDKARQLTISVTDGGYNTSAVDGKITRAVENGYTTEFTEGDACGLFMIRGLYSDKKMIYSNVKLTAERDAATGSLVWKPEHRHLREGCRTKNTTSTTPEDKADLDATLGIRMSLTFLRIEINEPVSM